MVFFFHACGLTGSGVSSPRMNSEAKPLPSARSVSLAVHKDSDRPHAHLMALTAVWGEFISHDIAHTPQFVGFQGSPIKCCDVSFENFHPECYPIRIYENDPYYGKTRENCQEYVRSSVAPRIGCTLGISVILWKIIVCSKKCTVTRRNLLKIYFRTA